MRKPALSEVPKLEVPAREPLAALEVTLITRLFGGGAKARELDEVSWLRPAALKSALRFWWRTGHAHNYGSLQELREREEYLFGTSGSYGTKGEVLGGPGVLEVEVVAGEIESRIYGAIKGEGPGNPLTVAYFPARAESDGTPARELGMPGSTAKLSIYCSSQHEADQTALRRALRLWLTLGGVGARTRRGAGAVCLAGTTVDETLKLPLTSQSLEAFLREHCGRQAAVGPAANETFALSQTLRVFVGRPWESGELAQKGLLSILKAVRQSRKPGKEGRPGRSNWPEPNAVRLHFNPEKRWRHDPDRKDAGRYPRAALGLPIVLKFQDDPPAEPPRHTIVARLKPGSTGSIQRYASPILLRPVKVLDGTRALFVPVAIITQGTLPPDAVPVVQGPSGEAPVSSYLITRQSDAIQKVVDAFSKAPGFRSLF